MIGLSNLVRQMNMEGDIGRLRNLIIKDYDSNATIFKGTIKDLMPLMFINTTKVQINEIKRNFGFDLETNLVFYRVYSVNPETHRDRLSEIMTGDFSGSDIDLPCDPENPVYVLRIYPVSPKKKARK